MFQGFVLAYPSGCSGPQCLNDPLRFGRKAEHDYPDGLVAVGELLAQAVSGIVRQIAIEYYDFGGSSRQ
jgi:hypothetical protein